MRNTQNCVVSLTYPLAYQNQPAALQALLRDVPKLVKGAVSASKAEKTVPYGLVTQEDQGPDPASLS